VKREDRTDEHTHTHTHTRTQEAVQQGVWRGSGASAHNTEAEAAHRTGSGGAEQNTPRPADSARPQLLQIHTETHKHIPTHTSINHDLFVCVFLSLPRRGSILKCVPFNTDLSVANQMSPSRSPPAQCQCVSRCWSPQCKCVRSAGPHNESVSGPDQPQTHQDEPGPLSPSSGRLQNLIVPFTFGTHYIQIQHLNHIYCCSKFTQSTPHVLTRS